MQGDSTRSPSESPGTARDIVSAVIECGVSSQTDDSVGRVVPGQHLSEWCQNLCLAVEKLQAITRHMDHEGATVAEWVLMDIVLEAEYLVAGTEQTMRGFIKQYEA